MKLNIILWLCITTVWEVCNQSFWNIFYVFVEYIYFDLTADGRHQFYLFFYSQNRTGSPDKNCCTTYIIISVIYKYRIHCRSVPVALSKQTRAMKRSSSFLFRENLYMGIIYYYYIILHRKIRLYYIIINYYTHNDKNIINHICMIYIYISPLCVYKYNMHSHIGSAFMWNCNDIYIRPRTRRYSYLALSQNLIVPVQWFVSIRFISRVHTINVVLY